jgi:hypothetical protein
MKTLIHPDLDRAQALQAQIQARGLYARCYATTPLLRLIEVR